MRTWMTAAAVVAAAGLGAGSARADEECGLVRSFYGAYLHRDADECGLAGFVRALRCGMSPEDVQCQILGSDEYYHLHGCTPEGFAAGLYEDVLGREPCRREVCEWARAAQCGCRAKAAHAFLCAAQRELASRQNLYAPPAYDPPPYAPPPGYAPPYDDSGRVSIHIRLGR